MYKTKKLADKAKLWLKEEAWHAVTVASIEIKNKRIEEVKGETVKTKQVGDKSEMKTNG